MSSIDWVSTLAMPPGVRQFERPIPVHVLAREAELTRTQREGLGKIEALTLLGVAQEATTRIPAAPATDRRIDAVLFVRPPSATRGRSSRLPPWCTRASRIHRS